MKRFVSAGSLDESEFATQTRRAVMSSASCERMRDSCFLPRRVSASRQVRDNLSSATATAAVVEADFSDENTGNNRWRPHEVSHSAIICLLRRVPSEFSRRHLALTNVHNSTRACLVTRAAACKVVAPTASFDPPHH